MKNKNSLWYPYIQMKTMSLPLKVSSAKGVHLHLEDGTKLIDAISSWWCVIHGYNHTEINKAAKQQLAKMAHVMLGGLTHEPAEQLSNKLVKITPPGLNHVFFSDSGSVGVDVALKMSMQYWQNLNKPKKNKFLALRQAYHGDTIGAMSVGDPVEGMHKLFSGLLPKNYFLPAPKGGFNALAKTVNADLVKLETFLANHHPKLAGFILEPILQAAGGFNIYSPLYLKGARKLCDKYNVLLIFDEVATGFGRTGKLFAAEHAQVTPDIMILGKGLTAGYLGMAATLTTSKIFTSFLDDSPVKAFMHGPTFMGNPLACAIALKSIEIFEKQNYLEKISCIETQLKSGLSQISHPQIKDIRVIGATGVIEVKDKAILSSAQEFARQNGVWLRPFDNYLYTMPPYIISNNKLTKIIDTIQTFFKNKKII
ncbi:adenosylmethionine--8-amino-7-oxononanoate transaminase [Candidatus Margulisiibacteriota bacterium]